MPPFDAGPELVRPDSTVDGAAATDDLFSVATWAKTAGEITEDKNRTMMRNEIEYIFLANVIWCSSCYPQA